MTAESTLDRGPVAGAWGAPPQLTERGSQLALTLLVVTIGVLFGFGLLTGWQETETMILLLVLAAPVGILIVSTPHEIDARWLPTMVVAGFAAKMVASAGRYWALQVLYNGSGDATGYHNHGTLIAPIWRSLQIPEFEPGTEFLRVATGLLYVPYEPTKLGGFLLFASLAFMGQILLYAALRRAHPSPRLKGYALLIFFFPNVLYWPSSIGKESLMMLFIGVAAYGVARLITDYRVGWLMLVGVGTVGCAVIRSHIAFLIVLSLAVAVIGGKAPQVEAARSRRLLVIGLILVGLAFSVRYALSDFNVDLSAGISDELLEDELDPIFGNVESQTDKGGSSVEGSAIRSPLDIPEALLRVVFRPLPYEAHNTQTLVNSFLEGTLLLGLFIYRMPAIVRNFRRRWRSPYVLFSLVYTAGFVFGHSAVLNLGIMARQRSQLIPFVLVLLVVLGAPDEPDRRRRGHVEAGPWVRQPETPELTRV